MEMPRVPRGTCGILFYGLMRLAFELDLEDLAGEGDHLGLALGW